MKTNVLTTAALALSLLSGCAALHSVSMSPIPAQRSKPVKAEVSDWNVLGFKFDNDFVNGLPTMLQNQCPEGKVTGIMTRYETRFYFFAAKRIANATGYCVAKGA